MNSLRALALIPFFFLDIQVKAESHHDPKAVHQGAGCWGKEIPCAVVAKGGKKTLDGKGIQIVLAPGALVEQRSDDVLQLVAGTLYAEVSKPLRFSTPYGTFWCEGECKGLFERRAEAVKIKSLGGEWSVKRTGESQQIYGLKSGLQFWISEVETDGKAGMDFPKSLPWLETVKSWAGLFPGTPEEFKKAVTEFRGEWQEGVETASSISYEAAKRLIASKDQELARAAAIKKAQEAEDERLRARFREKNYVDF